MGSISKYIKNDTSYYKLPAGSWVTLSVPSNFNKIAQGGYVIEMMALQEDKTNWAWGFNALGALGINSIINKISPISISGAAKTFCEIAKGNQMSLALTQAGRAWSWGNNTYGNLGINSTTLKSTPTAISGATKTFCKIAGAAQTLHAIDKNGKVWGWGANNYGVIGDNSVTSRRTPVSILGGAKTFCDIIVGDFHTLAIDKNGRLWAWGFNNSGQLGIYSTTSTRTPKSVLGGAKTFCQITAGYATSLAIDKSGKAWAWGINSYGILGDNSTTARSTPVAVGGANKTFCKIVTSVYHSMGLDKNGKIWTWGWNYHGVLGTLNQTDYSTPVSVLGAAKTFCQITARQYGSFGLDKDNNLWAWGFNFFGALGIPLEKNTIFPNRVEGTSKTFCSIEGDMGYHTIGIDKDGKAWGWGTNSNGCVGDNSATNRSTPVAVGGANKTFCFINSGVFYNLALTHSGELWVWGVNAKGQLGINSVTESRTPKKISGSNKTFCKISASSKASGGITQGGALWMWGDGGKGALGVNSVSLYSTPVSISGGTKTFCHIGVGITNPFSDGVSFAGAIDKNGRIWTWGNNDSGQLGVNSVVSYSTPVSILGANKTFCQISVGSHMAAIDKNGKLWAWGANAGGRLGDNSATNRSTPVAVGGANKTFCKVFCGFQFTCAIDKNGKMWAWGLADYGVLGNININTSVMTPMSVYDVNKTFCNIRTGANGNVAIDNNGGCWSWGQFGAPLGRLQNTFTPIKIVL